MNHKAVALRWTGEGENTENRISVFRRSSNSAIAFLDDRGTKTGN